MSSPRAVGEHQLLHASIELPPEGKKQKKTTTTTT